MTEQGTRRHFQARLAIDGKTRTLGSFDTLRSAVAAYRSARMEAYGDFA